MSGNNKWNYIAGVSREFVKRNFTHKKNKTALLSRLAIHFVSSMIAVKLNTPKDGDPGLCLSFNPGGIRRQGEWEVMEARNERHKNNLILKVRAMK